MCTIGKNSETGEAINLDIPLLVKTRLLIQSNSGGGKSYLLRKILEETHGKIPQIVIDIEGEFASLREKYNYILVGKDGDIDINIKIAEILPKKLLELKASVIMDLSELKHHERILFVKRFLDSLVNVPKKLRTPYLVIIDEVHLFCPEKGKSESMGSVIDLATRGRKRGFACIGATQRLSKLNKDFAAEMINKLIGRTGLDIDMKRASEELGFVTKQQMLELRNLEPGEFFAFGPALSKKVIKIRIGKVKTTHPDVGGATSEISIPPTPDKIKKLLEKLGDLPKGAEEELRTSEDFKRKIRQLNFEVGKLKRQGSSGIGKEDIKEIKNKITTAVKQQYDRNIKEYEQKIKKHYEARDRKIQQHTKDIADSTNKLSSLIVHELKEQPTPVRNFIESNILGIPSRQNKKEPYTEPLNSEDPKQLRAGAMKMLKAVAMFSPTPITKNQIATLSGFSAKGGTFSTYLSELKRNGWIREEHKRFTITEEGFENVGDYSALPTEPQELIDMWAGRFRAGAARMLKAIGSKYPSSIQKEELAEETDFTMSGGTFNTYLSELRRNRLIVIQGNEIIASKELFLEN